MANGHSDAFFYPVGRVAVEYSFVEAHLNGQLATQAALVQMALSTILGGKEARDGFSKEIKFLQNID